MRGRHTPWLGIATIALICLALTACSSGTAATDDNGSGSQSADFSSAKVDTPELRAQKAAAGIADCPVLTGTDSAHGLPAVTLPCLGGGPDVDLADVRGPALVNLWATYCAPCRSEAPILQQAHTDLGDRLDVLGVDYQEPQPGKAIAFADELGLTFPMVSDPNAELKQDLRVPGLPMTLLIDDQGEVVFTKAGAIDDAAELADLLNKHLGIDDAWAAG